MSPASAVVGNDVVDLADPRTGGKAESPRFLERVCTADERAKVEASDDPHRTLWAVWACKEAAYKVASKLRGSPPVFAHQSFAVTLVPPYECPLAGTVRWEELEVPVTIAWDAGWVHACAVAPDVEPAGVRAEVRPLEGEGLAWDAPFDALRKRFTERETEAVHSAASAAVRLAARAELAELLDVPEGELEIVCAPGPTGRRPPSVLLGGRPAAYDVSLSHHGRWLAWAIVG